MAYFGIGIPDRIVGLSNSDGLYYGRKEQRNAMGSIKLKPKAVKVVCNNCFRITTGYRDENGVVKYQCTRCGATSVSKVMGRRHVQLDIYAPAGQELLDEDM